MAFNQFCAHEWDYCEVGGLEEEKEAECNNFTTFTALFMQLLRESPSLNKPVDYSSPASHKVEHHLKTTGPPEACRPHKLDLWLAQLNSSTCNSWALSTLPTTHGLPPAPWNRLVSGAHVITIVHSMLSRNPTVLRFHSCKSFWHLSAERQSYPTWIQKGFITTKYQLITVITTIYTQVFRAAKRIASAPAIHEWYS